MQVGCGGRLYGIPYTTLKLQVRRVREGKARRLAPLKLRAANYISEIRRRSERAGGC